MNAGLLEETGKRTRKHVPLYVINEAILKEWAAKDPIEKEIEQRFRELSSKPIDSEDAAEEAAWFVADEQNDHDQVETEGPLDPDPGKSLHTNCSSATDWLTSSEICADPERGVGEEIMPPEVAAALRQHLPSNGTSAFKY